MWWLLKDFDARVSLMLGRSLRRTALQKEIPRPLLESLPDEEKTFRRNIQEFSSLVLEAMELVNSKKTPAHDAYARTLEGYLLRLHEHQAQLPLLQQEPHITNFFRIAIADHQIEVQLLEIAIRCALIRCFSVAPTIGDEKAAKERRFRSFHDNKTKNMVNNLLQSARIVSDTFAYIHDIDSSIAVSSWPRCFGMYCAAVMLAVSLLRRETVLDEDVFRVERALVVFQCCSASPSQSNMAPSAIATLSELLGHIRLLVSARDESIWTMPRDEGTTSSMPRDDSPPVLSESQDGRAATHADAKWREQFSLKHETTSVHHNDEHGGRIKRNWRHKKRIPTVQEPMTAAVLSLQDVTKPQLTLPTNTDGKLTAAISNYELSMQNSAAQLSYPNSAVASFHPGGQINYVPMIYSRAVQIDSAQPLNPYPFARPPVWIEGLGWTELWQPQNALMPGESPFISNEQGNPQIPIPDQIHTGIDNFVPMTFCFPIVSEGSPPQNGAVSAIGGFSHGWYGR
ncbi:hypothetical protein H2204_005272 [Knufia peltigerae]|uniref:Uncharacterized protein n=1 Tax=Knufia peltigerae TaxID=1002370 RepID=A0AA38Y5N5_9EURO|nr:hypothetical protein H2204_005272 [Knufia peltigerae]